MIEKDHIKDLFAKGLQDYQTQVDPALWASISSSIKAGATKTGLGLLSKILIGISVSAVTVGAVYLSSNANTTKDKQIPKESKEIVVSKEPKENTAAPQINQKQTYHHLQSVPGTNYLTNEEAASVIQLQISQEAPEQISNVLSTQSVTPTIIAHSIAVDIPTQTVQSIVPAPTSATQTPIKVVPNQLLVSLPNIFTPNNDGQNEMLQIDWKQNTIEDFSIVVLNKENQVAFSSSNPHFDWDGSSLGGEKLARGVYIYFVAGVLNGQKWQQSSSLQIQY